MSQVKEKLAALGLDPDPGTPEALSLLIAAEIKKWAAVVRQSGAKIIESGRTAFRRLSSSTSTIT